MPTWLSVRKRHAQTVDTLNLIAQTITSSLDIEKVIHRTMAGINALLEVEAGSILLLDEEKEETLFQDDAAGRK